MREWPSDFQNIGLEIGRLVAEKNKAYGDSANTSGEALALLFPKGVPPEKYHEMLLMTRIWDKLMRIATDRDALGEDPWSDITGYGILGVRLIRELKGRSKNGSKG